ncbi:MAG TPA: ABC-2 family transporter protein [Thermotogota bacterium]|nr:ABC-2 family transporter protein [Thermotogota bacterium]HRW92649.1 ABC-2 family transporter protein [Thermotogota bacterium]
MGVFLTLVRASWRAQTHYRFNFFFTTVSSGLAMFSDFLLIWWLLMNFPSLGGWKLEEVACIFGIVNCSWGLFRVIGVGLKNFQEFMLSGRFDVLLVRPASTVLQLLLHRFDLKSLGGVVQGLGIGFVALTSMGLLGQLWPWFLLLCLLGAIITLEINIILAAIAFWTIRNEEIVVLAFYATRTASEYPAHIFGPFLKNLLTFAIPLATIGYFPLGYLLGKMQNPVALLSPFLAAGGLFPISFVIWKMGMHHYSSTGT